jgi:patatin-like phospholipase/acyl hydrolase
MINNELSTYLAIKTVLENKEVVTDELITSILQTAGITPDQEHFQKIKFMLNRFLISARIKQIFSFEDKNLCISLIIEMLSPSYKCD